MLMGLTNMPETFMRMINTLFLDFLDKVVMVLLDDILIYCMTVEQHFELLEKVLTRL